MLGLLLFKELAVEWLYAQQVEAVGQEESLHVLVHGRAARKTGTDVDFEDPRLEAGVDEDVEAENLEAAVLVLGGAHTGYDWVLSRNDRLDADVLHLVHHFVVVDALLLILLPKLRKTQFRLYSRLVLLSVGACVFHVGTFVLFVDTEVGKVHKSLF